MKQTAIVGKIISVTPCLPYDAGWVCDVLCTDGKIRTISNFMGSDNLAEVDGECIIKNGFSFEVKSELPPQLCQTDYKTIYETIDKFLVENEGVLLGNIMKTLHGRENPAQVREIIKKRLLID